MAGVTRDELRQLLEQWHSGTVSPGEVVIQARERWLAGDGAVDDTIALDVLMMLATAHGGSVTHEDIPALMKWLGTPAGQEASGFDRYADHMLALDLDARDRLARTDYYGSARGLEEDADFFHSRPAERDLHRAAREDPESIWDELRRVLCAPTDPDNPAFWADILEDVVFRHEDQFIERLEALARECPGSRPWLAGITEQVGERFAALQWQLQRELDATR